MDTFDDLYGSQYLSAADVGRKILRGTIAFVAPADLRQKDGTSRRKFVIGFREDLLKDLVVNKTNAVTLANLYGKDVSKWAGRQVEIYTAPTSFGDGVRIRVPQVVTGTTLPDDDIPEM
jgi:hypothetical protein